MEYQKFENTYLVRLDRGEEVLEQVKALSLKEHISLATVQGLGAVNDLTLGVFRPTEKTYHSNRFQGCYEIVSLTGTVSTMNGEYYCHLHMSAGDESGHVVGGHLNRAVISATGELVVTVIPGTVDRAFDPEVGLNLLKF
jgi:predicted DNA-binding protein with PD1-like motif